MDVESIRNFCLSFPDATEKLQWGEDLCFKVRGKIFAVLDLRVVPQRLSFKCTPEKFAEPPSRRELVLPRMLAATNGCCWSDWQFCLRQS